MYKLYLILSLSLLTFGCGGQRTDEAGTSSDTTTSRDNDQDNAGQVDQKVYYDSARENLKFKIPDTLRSSKSFYFSNRQTKDLFLLTINPGLINKSKSELKIVTVPGRVIYTQVFDSYYFIHGIFLPDSIPSGGQEVYDRYLIKYRKSLTQNQYASYVKKEIDNFYDAIYFIKRDKLRNLAKWGDANKDAVTEVLGDTTIIVTDITCFDCDEGGEMIFYSKKKGGIESLMTHD
jgi:hypothetical protein